MLLFFSFPMALRPPANAANGNICVCSQNFHVSETLTGVRRSLKFAVPKSFSYTTILEFTQYQICSLMLSFSDQEENVNIQKLHVSFYTYLNNRIKKEK